ncbi:MAG: type II toxin-antitoxin system HicB family antitoxin [Nitrospiria bacterium]
MKKIRSDNYLKIVEWSDEDNCYIGTSPGLFDGGVHGTDESKVFKELCDTVGETINLMVKEGKPLPTPTANKTFSGKISLRISPDLHKALTMRALQEGQSVNRLIQHKLEETV